VEALRLVEPYGNLPGVAPGLITRRTVAQESVKVNEEHSQSKCELKNDSRCTALTHYGACQQSGPEVFLVDPASIKSIRIRYHQSLMILNMDPESLLTCGAGPALQDTLLELLRETDDGVGASNCKLEDLLQRLESLE